jgi:hypothetical protein
MVNTTMIVFGVHATSARQLVAINAFVAVNFTALQNANGTIGRCIDTFALKCLA